MITQERLLELLGEHLASRAPLAMTHFSPLTSGWANDVYAFDLSSADGQNEALILKQFTVADAARKETQALQALTRASYPVPRVLLAQDNWILMERVAGEPLWQTYEAQTEAGRAELTTLFVRLLVDLQRLDASILASSPTADEIPRVEIERLRADRRSEFSPVIDWLETHRVRCPRAVISHRDYHPWNVLLDATGKASVIDWDWQIADPRFDLAWMLALMQRSGFEPFSTAAQAAYEAQTGQPVEDLAYFKVLATTRWLMNVTRSLQAGANLREGATDEFRLFLETPMQRAAALITEYTGISLKDLL